MARLCVDGAIRLSFGSSTCRRQHALRLGQRGRDSQKSRCRTIQAAAVSTRFYQAVDLRSVPRHPFRSGTVVMERCGQLSGAIHPSGSLLRSRRDHKRSRQHRYPESGVFSQAVHVWQKQIRGQNSCGPRFCGISVSLSLVQQRRIQPRHRLRWRQLFQSRRKK